MEIVLLLLNLTGVIMSVVVNQQYYMHNITGTLFYVLEGAIILIEIISLIIALKRSGSITEELAANKAAKKEEESKNNGLGGKRILDYIVVAIIIVGMSYIISNSVTNEKITNYQDELLNNKLLEQGYESDLDFFEDFDDEDDEDFYADANYEYVEENTTSNSVSNTVTNNVN